MTKSRLFQVVAFIAIVAFLVCGQQALAQESRHHLQARAMPGMHKSGVVKALTHFDQLFQLESGMGVLPPLDGSGNDYWPCRTGGSDADCSSIPSGGIVVGLPAYTWSLADCNANAAGAPNCGQIFWFYEDDTGDNTDHLIVSVVVKQGLDFILDTGNIDFGPNPFAPGTVVGIFGDTAFGTLGATGKGNGFCAGSKKVCVNPVTGIATFTITTTVGASRIMKSFDIFLQ
jgi:hypothetical protein